MEMCAVGIWDGNTNEVFFYNASHFIPNTVANIDVLK